MTPEVLARLWQDIEAEAWKSSGLGNGMVTYAELDDRARAVQVKVAERVLAQLEDREASTVPDLSRAQAQWMLPNWQLGPYEQLRLVQPPSAPLFPPETLTAWLWRRRDREQTGKLINGQHELLHCKAADGTLADFVAQCIVLEDRIICRAEKDER